MRHGKKINHLGRTASHRKAMLSNMATSLIQNKRIVTTVAKAKALRKYVEPIITKSKTDTTHSRRMVFRYLQDKESVNILFNEVSERVANREGGYTRILKTGSRLGDNASMCVIELVDYNESMLKETTTKRSKTRRGRRGKGGDQAEKVAAAVAVAEVTETMDTETAVEEAEQVVEETTEAAAAVAETAVEEAEQVVEETTEAAATVAETAVEEAEQVVEETTEAAAEAEAAPESPTEEEE